MKQQYKEINLRSDSLRMIALFNQIIDDYAAQGFKLSVRQLYYQLVARALIENTEQSYKRVASIINDGRVAGLIDWDAIEDRNRDIEVRNRWTSGRDIIVDAQHWYHMDMWDNQIHRPIVIVEKAALAGVLGGVCRKYDIPLLAARGYPSVSIMREMAIEHIMPAIDAGQIPFVLHLGDHDPSGIDMTRDLDERLQMFAETQYSDTELSIERIALTMRQVGEKSPPPNPAKTTDSRFKDYRKKFGDESWELDALEPQYLVDLVTAEVEKYIDWERWAEKQQEIIDVKKRIKALADDWKEAA